MRINIYSQELTSETTLISKESDGCEVTGIPCLPNGRPNGKPRERLPDFLVEIWRKTGRLDFVDATNPYRDVKETPIVYHAARLMLHSSDRLHRHPLDDDRSAITFWLPRSKDRREDIAKAFERLAELFRTAPLMGEKSPLEVEGSGQRDWKPEAVPPEGPI